MRTISDSFSEGEMVKISFRDAKNFNSKSTWAYVTVLDQIDDVVMVLPHWSGHEQIYKKSVLRRLS